MNNAPSYPDVTAVTADIITSGRRGGGGRRGPTGQAVQIWTAALFLMPRATSCSDSWRGRLKYGALHKLEAAAATVNFAADARRVKIVGTSINGQRAC